MQPVNQQIHVFLNPTGFSPCVGIMVRFNDIIQSLLLRRANSFAVVFLPDAAS